MAKRPTIAALQEQISGMKEREGELSATIENLQTKLKVKNRELAELTARQQDLKRYISDLECDRASLIGYCEAKNEEREPDSPPMDRPRPHDYSQGMSYEPTLEKSPGPYLCAHSNKVACDWMN